MVATPEELERTPPAYDGERALVVSENTWREGALGSWRMVQQKETSRIQVTAPELPELKDLPREVVELVYAVERYMTHAQASAPDRAVELWREMGQALNAVWGRKDGTP